jgi:hypothetical protein
VLKYNRQYIQTGKFHLPDLAAANEVFFSASIIFFLSLSAAGSAIETLTDSSYTG